MLQGLYGASDRDRPLVRVPFTSFTVVMVLLPLTGLIACIFISLLYHFKDANYTHCQVSNYLPSISAAISNVPERYIWRVCIGLHSAPRFLTSAAYFSFYRGRLSGRLLEQLTTILTLLASLAENSGLLLLTYVGSTESYDIHKNGFMVFVGASVLHMMLTCRLWFVIKRHFISTEELKSFRWKMRLFVFNISCCAAAFYFFRRHNNYCETGVYTLFALCEYLVVLSNMAFHTTVFWDFGGKEVIVGTPPEDKRY